MTSLHFTSTDKPPVDHQWESITFCNPVSGLKYLFWNPWLYSLYFFFSSLQTDNTITSETSFEPVDPRINPLLATHYDCSRDYNLRQFALTVVQKCSQAPTENECIRKFVSVSVPARAEQNKNFGSSAAVQKNRFFYAQVHIPKAIDKIVRIGIIIQWRYRKNWIVLSVKTLSETMMEWGVLNLFNHLLLAFSSIW